MEEKQKFENQEMKVGPQQSPSVIQSEMTVNPDVQHATGSANGQPFAAQVNVTNQPEIIPARRPSKWRYVLIILGILQAVGVALFFIIITWAIRQSRAGVSGMEFVVLLIYATLVPGVGIIALINLISLPIYMTKHKPRGKGLIFSLLSLFISLGLFFLGAYSVYQLRVSAPKHINDLSAQTQQKIAQSDQQYKSDNLKPEITKEQAIDLLKNCQLAGFYYTNQNNKEDGNWGELSTTGIVLTKINGKPYRISIADKLVPELVPIAREAQKTCPGPQFWYSGHYEQRQADGTWK